MSDIALQTSGLGVKYGNFHALADVDLKIRRNSVHSIIGPNGAGKTTLFHALTGRVRASSGRIELDGHDITGTSDDDRVRLGIARSFQVTSLFPNLTLRENLRLAAQGRTPWQTLAPWRRADTNTASGAGSSASTSAAGPSTRRKAPSGVSRSALARALDARSARRSTPMARAPSAARHHSTAIEPAPVPTSHSNCPGSGRRCASALARTTRLVRRPSLR